MTEGYNGWKNYETWVVKLWIDNEEGSYSYRRERAKELKDAARPRVELADELKEAHEDAAPTEEAGVYTDLLYSALGEVDWHEIAENILEEVKE